MTIRSLHHYKTYQTLLRFVFMLIELFLGGQGRCHQHFLFQAGPPRPSPLPNNKILFFVVVVIKIDFLIHYVFFHFKIVNMYDKVTYRFSSKVQY